MSDASKTTDLPTLRAQRDAAREPLLCGLVHTGHTSAKVNAEIDTLLRLHAQVVTLENAEKLEQRTGSGVDRSGMADAAAFLRATVEGA